MSQFQYVCRASEDVEREMNERAILSEKEELRRLEDLYGPKGEWCKAAPEAEPVSEENSEWSFFSDCGDSDEDDYDDSPDLDMSREDDYRRRSDEYVPNDIRAEAEVEPPNKNVTAFSYHFLCALCGSKVTSMSCEICPDRRYDDDDDWEADAPNVDAEHFFPALIRRRLRTIQLPRSQRRYCA